MRWMEQDTTQFEQFLCRNAEYVIYKVLTRERIKGVNWQDEEKNRKRKIEALISNYGYEEFKFLFTVCKKVEKKQVREAWSLQRSIEFIFECVYPDSKKYLLVMKAYFIVNTPYLYNINDKVANLLKMININELMVMIDSLDEINKKRWETAFYEEFPEEEITIEIVKWMVKFIYKQSGSEYIQIPNICSLAKYKNKGINSRLSSERRRKKAIYCN